jgi:imidazolonepropionase-like amidohydrolase
LNAEQDSTNRGPTCKPLPTFSTELFDINKDRLPIKVRAKLIKNGRGISNGTVIENFSVYIGEDGKIIDVGVNINPKFDVVELIDAEGKFIMPGLVDGHSHLGVSGLPSLWGNSDTNEMTYPTTPFVRAIDALDAEDFAIDQILRSGVTTSLVLPGSGNIMGGEGVVVKNKMGTSNSDMLFQGSPRVLKMACGENPKRVYGSKGVMPMSRMGSAWLMRQRFEAARNLIQQQDAYDCSYQPQGTVRPDSLELLPLTYLLRRHPNITLHVHCYETKDIEMLIRLSQEFGFKIDTIQHALEAYKIADILKKWNITVATFSDMFGFKLEAYDSSVNAPHILEKAGVNVVLKSDHPVTHAQWLLQMAGKAHYYGMTAQGALDAVTINAAKGLRLGHRIGALKPGYDADIVLFDRHPLLLGARPDKVFIDGQLMIDNKLPLKTDKKQVASSSRNDDIIVSKGTGDECKSRIHYNSYAIDNARIYTMDGNIINNGKVVVVNGNISCVGSCIIPNNAVVFSVTKNNGIVTPGLIESVTDLGLVEISAEVSTYDGYSSAPYNEHLRARDAIRMESRSMQAAFKAGVTTSISHRMGDALVNGQSVAFHTIGRVISETVIKESVAMQISVGVSAKNSGDTQSISGQIGALRKWLQEAKTKYQNSNDTTSVMQKVMSGLLPLVVSSHQADDIDQLLSLQDEFGFSLVIMGGAEAHLLSDKLKGRKVTVLVTPISESEYWNANWDTRRSSNDYGSSVLYKNGISFGIATGNTAHEVRNLRWMAGLLSTDGIGQLSFEDALASVTSKIADVFSLPNGVGRIKVGTRANLVLFDGNPLTYEGKPKLVAVGDTIECGDQLIQF